MRPHTPTLISNWSTWKRSTAWRDPPVRAVVGPCRDRRRTGRCNAMASPARVPLRSALLERQPRVAGDLALSGRCDRWLSLRWALPASGSSFSPPPWPPADLSTPPALLSAVPGPPL
jgi:hypothetical protein